MRKIDGFSRVIGALSCFNEMVSCGVKNIALGAPVLDEKLRDEHLEHAKLICEEKATKWFKDDDALLTDLFPVSLNKDKYNLVFYKDEKYLKEYIELKERKKNLVKSGKYTPKQRYKLSYDFGKLLSYTDQDIDRMIEENDEKESMNYGNNNILISSQITFLYLDDLEAGREFFENTFGFEVAVDQGKDYCSIYKISPSSFIGIVKRGKGEVPATTRDGVLISLVVDDLEQVHKKLEKLNLEGLTSLRISERLNIKSTMFIGPEGYKFEVEQFLSEEVVDKFYK